MPRPRFLTLQRILRIHEDQLRRYSGRPGFDAGLLEGALAAPKAGMRGEYFHSFPFGMAAAYLFHVAQDHPFVDGNKRTATVAALVFLRQNGAELDIGERELADFVLEVASGKKSIEDVEAFLKRHHAPPPPLDPAPGS